MIALLRAVGAALFLLLVGVLGFPGWYPAPLQIAAVALCAAQLVLGALQLVKFRRESVRT